MAPEPKLDAATKFFDEIQEDDPESTAMRFATDRRGTPHLASFAGVNVGAFATSAKAMLTFLDNPIRSQLVRTEPPE
jgi:hypothetical protein